MKNLFKKTLACCLAVCMVFTLCICAVTVSAEEYDGVLAIAVNPENVTNETTELVVTYTADAINYDRGIAAAQVDVSVPEGLTIKSVGIDAENFDENASIQFFAEGEKSVVLDTLSSTTEDVPVVADNVFSYIVWCYAPNATVLTAPATLIVTYEGVFEVDDVLTFTTDVEACKDAKEFINLEEKSVEITVESAACKHANVTVLEAVAATCTETGLTEGSKCADCDEVLVEQKVVEKIAHTPAEAVVENNVDATCYAEGSYDSVVYCAVEACKAEISRTPVVVEKTTHTPAEAVVENNVDATCYAEGSYDSVVYCSVADCKAEISRTPVVVEKIAHTPAEAVEENRVEAKPGVAGSYDSVVYCAVEACKAEISRTPMEIPALPEEIVPVLDKNLQFRDKIVTVTSAVNIRYRVYAETTKGINGYKSLGYHDIEVVVYGSEYSYDSANLYNTVQLPEREVAKSSTNAGYNFLYEGISMISLGHKVFAYIKAYDANGNYVAYSPVEEVSPEMLLKQTIADATTDNAKRTNIELLNMAAAAQAKFAADKAGTDLANDVAAGKLVNVGVAQDLAIKEMPELVAISDDPVWEAGIDPTFQSAHKLSIAARLQQSPGIRVNVGGRTTLDRSKLKVDFVYYDPDPSVKTTVTKTVEGVNAVQNGARWAFDVPNLEFHNSNQTITAKVYYDVNDDGELELIGTLQYSIDASIKETIETSSSNEVIKLNEAIAKFGLAFRVNKGLATI